MKASLFTYVSKKINQENDKCGWCKYGKEYLKKKRIFVYSVVYVYAEGGKMPSKTQSNWDLTVFDVCYILICSAGIGPVNESPTLPPKRHSSNVRELQLIPHYWYVEALQAPPFAARSDLNCQFFPTSAVCGTHREIKVLKGEKKQKSSDVTLLFFGLKNMTLAWRVARTIITHQEPSD